LSKAPDINALFQTAVEAGDISPASVQTIMTIPDIGLQIQNGLGIDVDDVQSNDPIQFAFLIDDTVSMEPLVDVVIKGYNLIRTNLLRSHQKAGIIVHTSFISGKILHPFQVLTNTPELTRQNYRATYGSTPLRDKMAIVLSRSLAKYQEFAAVETFARSFTVVLTDGRDNVSKLRPEDIAGLSLDVRSKVESHKLVFMGIEDGHKPSHTEIALKLGVHKDWILNPNNSNKEIQAAFEIVSQSALSASQATGGSFSQVALGGGF
jgi:hypothetical protein